MPSSSRYLEREFEEEQKISNLKRLRGKESLRQLESGQGDCERCCDEFCGCSICSCWFSRLILALFSFEHKCISVIIYTIFPLFIVLDYMVGWLAKPQGWYTNTVGQIVCHWSPTACAFWIAIALSATLVAVFSCLGKLTNFLCDTCPMCNTQQGVPPRPPAITVTASDSTVDGSADWGLGNSRSSWRMRREPRPLSNVIVV